MPRLDPAQQKALVDTYDRAGGIATSNCYWLFAGGIHPSRTRYKGRFPGPDRQRLAILEQNFVSTMSLFPKALWEELGGFDEELALAEDWDFWLRAILAGRRVALQPRPLALYSWRGDSLAADPARMDEHVRTLLGKALARNDLVPEERQYLKRRLAGPGPAELGRQGDAALRAGRYREAAASYRAAADLCPTEPALRRKARVLRAAPWLTGAGMCHQDAGVILHVVDESAQIFRIGRIGAVVVDAGRHQAIAEIDRAASWYVPMIGTSVASSGTVAWAMPMLALTCTCRPSSTNGARRASLSSTKPRCSQ